MKIIQCSLERNFHLSNEDRFLLEKISMSAQTEDNENEQEVLNELREKLATNFKAAYPKILMDINFEYAASNKFDKEWNAPPQQEIVNGNLVGTHARLNPVTNKLETFTDERINKGTIEEQIEACTTIKELESFKIIASMNPKLSALYEAKKKSLSITI